MRWVTYLSPSGGAERPGVIDDGCVLGYPEETGLGELLLGGTDVLAHARQRALAAPVEIIVEFEARVCAPFVPRGPVPLSVGGDALTVAPALVRGVDEGVPSDDALHACVGAAAVSGGGGEPAAYTPACLWQDRSGSPVQLSLGPALVTPDELGGTELAVSASVEDTELAGLRIDLREEWALGGRGEVRARLSDPTPLLEPGDELYVDSGPLGSFEIRVGATA